MRSDEALAPPDIKRVLCPIDFSDISAHVVDQEVAISRWYHARILALHVYNPLFIPVPTLPPPVDRVPQTEIERMQENTRACFKSADAEGIDVDVAVDIGHQAAEILNRAATLPADLIVIGTHGASGFEHLALGSVAEKVMRRAACPVLTVPPRAHAASALPFTRLLCAVDFSDSSLAAFEFSCSLARESGAALSILHVIEWPWVEGPAIDEAPYEHSAELAEFRRYLEKSAIDRLRTLVPDAVQARCASEPLVRHGKPYVEILRVAEEVRSDLIIIGMHGRNAAGIMLFGSTTNQVVRRAGLSGAHAEAISRVSPPASLSKPFKRCVNVSACRRRFPARRGS